MRTSGILFPVFSLPGKYGIGCFSEEAYKFVDFLKEAGSHRVWGFSVSVLLDLCGKSLPDKP